MTALEELGAQEREAVVCSVRERSVLASVGSTSCFTPTLNLLQPHAVLPFPAG